MCQVVLVKFEIRVISVCGYTLSVSHVVLSITLLVEPESTRTPSSRTPPSSMSTVGISFPLDCLMTWRIFLFLGLIVFSSFVLQALAKWPTFFTFHTSSQSCLALRISCKMSLESTPITTSSSTCRRIKMSPF